MTFRQAQDLSSLEYKIDRTIHLGCRKYVFDIDCSRKGYLCLSTVDSTINEVKSKFVFFHSSSGCYVALEDERNGNPYIILGNRNWVQKKRYGGSFANDRPVTGCKEASVLWMSNEKSVQDVRSHPYGCSPIFDYIPQGIVVRESGDILICLWNNKVGTQSLGKVISLDGKFEIFTDKNTPLYICPTYIAENGNGDICVSDVRAVVVTDAGGILRFRYLGNSSSSNFDPYGICCDSKLNIIVADMKNDKIHVIDKDGAFLHHVIYEGIKMPRALCIDENDNVYVGEWGTDSINVISR